MMMKTIGPKCHLILTLLICLGAGRIAVGQLTGNESRSELQAIITATEGEAIEPKQLLEVLKKFRETFGKYDIENVQPMIEVANVDQSKCNGPAFRNINDLLEKRKRWTLNMVPYLIDAKRRQFKVCRDILSHKMLESVDELSKKQVLQLDNIMKSVEEVRQAPLVELQVTINDWYEQIESVLKVWIKRQLDLKSIKDSYSFERKKRSEFGSCYSIKQEFTGPVQAYSAVMDDPEIVQLIDSLTLNWITKYNLCACIIGLDYEMFDMDEETNSSGETKKKPKSIWKTKLFKSSQSS